MKSKLSTNKRIYKFGKENPSYKERVKLICLYCKKEFEVLPSVVRKGRKFCTYDCRSNYIKGKNNPNWKGGRKTKVKCMRECKQYKEWRKKVFERDEYRCIGCHQIGGDLEAHHCIPISEDIGKIYDVQNGITLCKKCHSLIPKKGDKGYIYMDRFFAIIKRNEFDKMKENSKFKFIEFYV